MENKKPFTVCFSPSLVEKIKRLADKEHRPFSQMVSCIVNDWLLLYEEGEEEKEKKKG